MLADLEESDLISSSAEPSRAIALDQILARLNMIRSIGYPDSLRVAGLIPLVQEPIEHAH